MGKGLNPADTFRKQEKKKEISRNKKQKAVVKEVQVLLSDPSKIEAEMEKVVKELEGNRANKTLKDKLNELQRMREVALMKKSRETLLKKPEEKMEAGAGSSRSPQESMFYHPQYNPTGAPPPGQPPMYKSSQSSSQIPIYMPGFPSGSMYGQQGIPPPPPQRGQFGMPVQGMPMQSHPHYMPMPEMVHMMQMQSQQAMLGSVSGIPFGGMNGVPPPPPPRSSSSAEISIPSVSQTVSSGERAIRREKPKVRQLVVDPLDPAGRGYSERFKLPTGAVSKPLQTANPVEIVDVIVRDKDKEEDDEDYKNDDKEDDDEGEDDEEDDEEAEGDDHDDDEEEDEAEEEEDDSAHHVEGEEEDFDFEEIMQRRMRTQEDAIVDVERPTLTSTDPSIYSAPSEPQLKVDSKLSPSIPSIMGSSALSSLLAYGSDSDEEDAVDASSTDIPHSPLISSVLEPQLILLPKLKSVSLDPHMIALLPASLRLKRPPIQPLGGHLKQKRAPQQSHPTPILSTVKGPEAATLDDELDSFMSEINSIEQTFHTS